MNRVVYGAAWGSAMLLSACGSFETYKKPELSAPAAWHENADAALVKSGIASRPAWWKTLQDPTLDALIDKTLENNHDLKIAEARIVEAKALRDEALSRLYPSVDATASASRLGGQASLGNSNRLNDEWQVGIAANWMIDLFGQNRANVAAGDAATARTEAEYRNAKLSLISEVARTYVETRALQQRLALTQKNLDLEKETLRVTRIQYEAQAISKLDLLRASAQTETTRAELPSIEALLAVSYHRLAVLSGEAPGNATDALKKAQPVPVFSQAIIMDTPIAIIAARPDVQAAEYSLIEATSLKNAATAELFPKLTLSAFFGAGDASLFTASSPWSLGLNALLPLLNFGRIESQIDAADARKVQAFQAYQQSVLKALEEVENALINYDREIKRAAALTNAANANREAARLARIKYRAGDATFLDLLIAEERLLSVESDAVISHANAAKAAIALQTALGFVTPVSEPVKIAPEPDAKGTQGHD